VSTDSISDWRQTLGQAEEALANERYEEGWPLYEARLENLRLRGRVPMLPIPAWRGQPVERLMVWSEQGVGDAIMFGRWIKVAAEICPDIHVLCHPPAASVLVEAGVQATGLSSGARIPACDAWGTLGSLPLLTGRFAPPPPLSILPSAGPGRGVGVMTHGNPEQSNNANRSLSDEAARRLRAMPGAVSLDPVDTGAQDYLATARIIAGLERVVTVDTSVAHLAASMGKPTDILLCSAPDWRWGRGRSDCPWYPAARLHRQTTPGDWTDVLDAVGA